MERVESPIDSILTQIRESEVATCLQNHCNIIVVGEARPRSPARLNKGPLPDNCRSARPALPALKTETRPTTPASLPDGKNPVRMSARVSIRADGTYKKGNGKPPFPLQRAPCFSESANSGRTADYATLAAVTMPLLVFPDNRQVEVIAPGTSRNCSLSCRMVRGYRDGEHIKVNVLGGST
jgi:hypothetical protein